MEYSLSQPLSSSPRIWKHDVFTSFHGTDVRTSFLGHMLTGLERKGIYLFIDNNMERGKQIGPELTDAIKGSKIAIVLLSKNYASSTWCLNELVEIMKSNQELGQIVITVFYEVNPTDVMNQSGYFGEVFKKNCQGITEEETQTWRNALKWVATIAGYNTSQWETESAMIEEISKDVSNKLNSSTPPRDFNELVGMGNHMEELEVLLRQDLDEVRMIGILGLPGIGKTTIAKYLFSKLSSGFQLSTIMLNIRREYQRSCADEYTAQLQLHKQMLSQMMNHEGIQVKDLGVAKGRLRDKKVLIVLDDVDQLAQIDALAKIDWFGPGSRIIVTTQDVKILKAVEIKLIYKVKYPSTNDALHIFCMNAFGQMSPKEGFTKLAIKVTQFQDKLPLGLKVMGSNCRGMSTDEWENALPKLTSHLDGDIEKVLMWSYDALTDEEKYLFLHIACFFNEKYTKHEVETYLARTIRNVRQGLVLLTERSLISIEGNYISIHSLLVQLGKEIVRKESPRKLRKRQFLVDADDICELLSDCTSNKSSAIGIDFRIKKTRDKLTISDRDYEKFYNLQFLRIRDSYWMNPLWCLDYISPKLRLLDWAFSPMKCFSTNFNPEFLVGLIMPHSQFKTLWQGNKVIGNLKWINLSYSENLEELPDLSTGSSLQKLDLHKCSSLRELPSSIGNATNLQHLILRGCSRFVTLPASIGNATNLQELNLSECSRFVELPTSIGNATNLQKLNLYNCSKLVELPDSIGNATNLQELNLYNCSKLVELPDSIGNATNLQKLNLSGCSSLVKLHASIGNATNLQKIDLSWCSSLAELPDSIWNATNLQELNLQKCSSLVELPDSIGNATNLQKLNLFGCSSLVKLPASIGNATNFQKIDISWCSSLTELPDSIGNATNLQELNLEGCSSLVELPSSIWNAKSLQKINLSWCSSLVELPAFTEQITNLLKLNLRGCSSLREVPYSIGNVTNLQKLIVSECPNFSSANAVRLPCSIWQLTHLKKLYY